jgi:hypothetical protein
MQSRPATRPGGAISTRGAGKNAHVREEVKPPDTSVAAGQAQRLLDDPAFTKAFNAVRGECIRQIEGLINDGSPETDEIEREICRTLRTLNGVKRALSISTQGQTLREHRFGPRLAESEPEIGEDV